MERRLIAATLTAAVVAVMWLTLAPRQVGGPLSYVVVEGSSMHPVLRAGDLALVRRASRYREGDVVAYRSATLGRVVMHRIVEQRAARFVLRGDANDWDDADQPTSADIIGRMWVRAPGAGSLLAAIKTPVGLGLLGLIGVVGAWPRARRARPRSRDRTAIAPPTVTPPAMVAALAAVVTAAATVAAFVLPLHRMVVEEATYEHVASVTYRAATAPSAAYPLGSLTDPEPVFLELIDAMTVDARYRFASAERHRVEGSARLIAVLSDDVGWRRRLALGPSVELVQGRARLSGTLDLEQLRAITAAVGDQTGVRPPSHRLELLVDVEVHGSLAGRAFDDTASLGRPLRLEPLILVPEEAAQPRAEGVVTATRARPNRLGLEVAMWRVVAPSLLGMSIVFLLVMGRRRGDHSATHAHANRATRARDDSADGAREDGTGTPEQVVQVASLDSLVKLAAHTGGALLAEDEGHPAFAVQHAGVVYRYPVPVSDG